MEAGIKMPPAGHPFCARVGTGTVVDNAAAAQRRPGYIEVLRELSRIPRLVFGEWRLFMSGWDYLLVRMGNVHVCIQMCVNSLYSLRCPAGRKITFVYSRNREGSRQQCATNHYPRG